jgi:uncharacterized membrane protein YeaQ/YmgE (transglycosylase-associated protein family)
MSVESVLLTLLVGAIAGWLATVVVTRYGFGLGVNIVIGILGGLLGSWLFPKLGLAIGSGLIGSIATATLGAIVILLIVIGLQRIGWVRRRPLL